MTRLLPWSVEMSLDQHRNTSTVIRSLFESRASPFSHQTRGTVMGLVCLLGSQSV
jgi:hypothetical protein